MASKGKKGKKSKWEKVPLTDFIPETPGGMPAMPIKVTSWADEVDDDNDIYTSRKPQEPVVLPTAPRAARGPGVDEENIPTNPPFVAYVSNLPYDVLEEDLLDFFADMQVTNMRLPKDTNRPKGYGYVDFEDRQSLIDALALTNTSIKGRRVRIEVSNSNSEDRRGGRMGMNRDYGRRDNYDDADRNSDWRSGPRDEPSGDNDRFRSRGGGGFDKDRREERDSSASDNRPGAWREGRAPLPDLPDRGGSSFSDRRGFRSDDRGGDREFSRFGDRGSRDRDGSDRGDRGDRGGGSSFGPRRNYGGDRERDRDRNFGGDRGDRGDRPDRESDWGSRLSLRPPTAEPAAPAEARTRVKLNLQPRSKPIDPVVVKDDEVDEKATSEGDTPAAAAPPSAPAPTPVPAANIFGAAKPVDTTAREREIEERLAKKQLKAEEGERKIPSRDGGDRGERGGWVKRNGEGRSENEKDRPRPAWRSEEDRGERQADRPPVRHPPAVGRSDGRNDTRGPPSARIGTSAPRGGGPRPSESRGAERERKERDRPDGVPPMPKATDDPAPNFVASNKYSMLHEDADADINYD